MSSQPTKAERKALWKGLHARQPGFRNAVTEDVRITSIHRGEAFEAKNGLHVLWRALRLCWVSDAFFAHVCYRLRMRLKARRIPVLPGLLHKISMASAQVSIGDPVLLHPGIYIIHGDADEIVPFWMGRRVASSIPNATLITVPGGRHGDLFQRAESRLVDAIVGLGPTAVLAVQGFVRDAPVEGGIFYEGPMVTLVPGAGHGCRPAPHVFHASPAPAR